MKNELLFIAFLFACISANAQIQNGLVREQNSGKKPVADAQIIFTDAPPASSDQSGNFRIAFSGKKTGDLIFLKEIAKKGYEIVNERELQVLKIGNDNKLGKDIILAKAGVLDAAKKEYYDISDKALWASFNKEKNALQQQLKNAQISQETYLVKFDTLSRQLERQQKSLDALADVFARVNFDDVSEDYKKAFEFFEVGKIDEALVLLEKVNLLNRTKKRLQERKRIEKAANVLAQQKSANEKGIKEDIQGMQLQSQLYVLTFQIEKAEALYDQVVRLDSTDLEILENTVHFYRENHRYNKALKIIAYILQQSTAPKSYLANAHGLKGDIYTELGDFSLALMEYLNFHAVYQQLVKDTSNSVYYHANLSVACLKLGSTYSALGEFNKALDFYQNDINISKKLGLTFPNNDYFKTSLAISYNRLGDLYLKLKNVTEASISYDQSFTLLIELARNHPIDLKIKKNLAIAHEKIGLTAHSQGDLVKAKEHFENNKKLFQELYDYNPQEVSFRYGLATANGKLGLEYLLSDKLKAKVYLLKAQELLVGLNTDFPQNAEFREHLKMITMSFVLFNEPKKE